jgi:Spy/CpxP family protein refolding chaperone
MFTRLLLLAALAVSLASAQDEGSAGGGMPGMPGRGGMRGGDMGAMPGRQAPRTLDILTAMFKLDKDQKKTVKTILDDAQQQAAPIRDQMLKGRLEIAQAIQTGKGQDEIGQAVKGYSALDSRMTSIELKAFADIFKIMQPEQRKNATRLFMMTSGLFKGKNWDVAR